MQFGVKMASDINYEKEYDLNKKYYAEALIAFAHHLKKVGIIKENDSETYSERELNSISSAIRDAEVINSCTEDITRYGLYHHIKLNEDGVLDLSVATRASFFTKWIMNFRPINIDVTNINDSDTVVNLLRSLASDSPYNEDVQSENTIFGTESENITSTFLCNEIFSLYASDRILSIESNKNLHSIFEYIQGRELRAFLYTLRFRIKHQDTYTLLFNRIINSDQGVPPLAVLA